MAASQGCWARGLDGPWACGREDLSSRSSRAWLAGLDPCVAMQRAGAYLSCSCRCNTSQQAGHPWPVGVRCAPYADGAVDMAMAIRLYAFMPSQPASQPASNVHTYGRPDHRRRRTASAARYAWHARMICPSSGWASGAACQLLAGWPGGREAPFGGTWLCGFPH